MHRFLVKTALLCFLIFACSFSTWAQSTDNTSQPTWTEDNPNPKPYSLSEFPKWAVGIRRFEIITLGSFPIMFFYTSLVTDIVRMALNNGDMRYAPWPFTNESSYKATSSEQLRSVAIAAGLSLLIGTIDAIIVWSREKK